MRVARACSDGNLYGYLCLNDDALTEMLESLKDDCWFPDFE